MINWVSAKRAFVVLNLALVLFFLSSFIFKKLVPLYDAWAFSFPLSVASGSIVIVKIFEIITIVAPLRGS